MGLKKTIKAGYSTASKFIFTAFFVAVFFNSAIAQVSQNFAFEQNERMGRGVNIIGYDPIWNDMSKARMQQKHFRLIKEAGFDNVRIKISPFRFSQDEKFTIEPKFFKTLDWILEQSLANNLMPIVDFHEHNVIEKDPIGIQPMFLAMWTQIAEYYKDYPAEVVFEIANEPNMAPELWNELLLKAYKTIRKSNPDRTLLIGSIYGNQIRRLADLEIPEEDRNIIVAIHYYSPMPFTHQGAPWSTKNKDFSGVTWSATEEEKKAVKEDFDIASKWAKEHNRPLTLGEFGAYDKGDIKSRVAWTNFVAREAESRNWSWSYWQFDSDFIVYDLDKDEWFEPIKNALIPTENHYINTVSGPINENEIGLPLAHEHVMSNFGAAPDKTMEYDEELLMAQVIPYLKKLKGKGINTIFDCTAANFGRRVDLLKTISEKSGVQIVTNTGFYGAANDRYIPEFVLKANKDEIAKIWVDEFENGIEGTSIRPGFIKLAFDNGKPSEIDTKLFEAGILAHQKTGLTMAVHSGSNPEAVKLQTDLLTKSGVKFSSWIWVHADQSADTEKMIELAKKGAWISLDGFKIENSKQYLERLQLFKSKNLLNKVLLSHDGNSFPMGGRIKPYEAILIDFIPELLKNGFTQQEIDQIMIKNPAQAFGIKTMNNK